MKNGRMSNVGLMAILVLVVVFAFYAFAGLESVTLNTDNESWTNLTNVTLNCSYTISGADGNVSNLTLYHNIGQDFGYNATNSSPIEMVGPGTYSYNFTVNNTPEGEFLWTCYAGNFTGEVKWSDYNYTLYIDRTEPSPNMSAPSNGLNISGSTVDFNWTPNDNMDPSLTCNLTIDAVVNVSDQVVYNNTGNNSRVFGLSDGLHYWNVTCWDNASNLNISELWHFTVDTAAPHTIALNSYWQGINISATTIDFNWTATDAGTATLGCNLTIDGVVNGSFSVVSGVKYNVQVTNFAQGTHQWNVTCNDTMGYTNSTGSETWDFVVDTVAPLFEFISDFTQDEDFSALTLDLS
ncbi:MAG: hypothetical protein ABIB71_00415 [Candidatus Woesearchaeota archaeon]